MSRSRSSSPSAKRIKLEDFSPCAILKTDPADEEHSEPDDSENNCSICLQAVVDRTVVPKCSHEFCFECLLVWTEQSRRCPLCSQSIGDYLIHSIRSRYDYRKHYLAPLRTSPPLPRPAQNHDMLQNTRQHTRRRRRERIWGTREQDRDHEESDKLERSITKRRWLYEHDLYAKHVASNAFTKYRPYPTPSQFAASQELISRTTTFLRRELQVWESLDVEFLTTLIISLMKAIDIRSESAVKLISEFLDMDEPYTPGMRHRNAEHFAHEVYSYVRSPYKDLFVYDSVVQYDSTEGTSAPPDMEQSRRWYQTSSSHRPRRRSPSPPRQQGHRRRSSSSERQTSWSPSGRRYSPPAHDIEDYHPPEGSRRKHRRSPDRKASLPSSSQVQIDDTQGSLKSKGKGKQRANASPPSEAEVGLEPIQVSKLDVDRTPPSNTALTEETQAPSASNIHVRTIKPPRNRSLLDSVKEHLGQSTHSLSILGAANGVHHHTHPVPPSAAPSNSQPIAYPALLSRLSDPYPSSVATTPTSSSAVPGVTTPGLLQQPAPESGSSKDFNVVTTLVADKSKQGEAEQGPSDASLSAMEARARLMARLNREKRQATATATSSVISDGKHDISMHEPPRSGSDLDIDQEGFRKLRVDDGTVPTPEEDSESREAKLRLRAQLRRRLTAEKRLVMEEK